MRLPVIRVAVLFLGIAFAFLPMSAKAASPPQKKEVFSSLNFDQALARAKKEKKVVFIDFYATWCGPCKMLDKTTWQDPKVIKWLEENTIPLKIDAEKEVELAKRYGVRAYPTMAFINPDGKILDTIIGYHPPEKFLPKAVAYLSGKSSVDMAREELRGHENDPWYRLRYAGALVDHGQTEKALTELLWCFDSGPKYDPKFREGGLLRVVSALSSLSKQSDAAKNELQIRRDQIQKQFVAEPNVQVWLSLLAVMNRGLGQPERMLTLFDELMAKGDSGKVARQRICPLVLLSLIEAKRYQDLLDNTQNPVKGFEAWQTDLQKQSQQLEARLPKAEYLRELDKIHLAIIRHYGAFYEALVGVGRIEEAETLARNLAKFDNRPETLTRLMNHAVRAGNRKSALAVAELRQNLAKAEERAVVEAAAAKIPNEK
jgi:thiol-disulfide isomerase/thioredoxin